MARNRWPEAEICKSYTFDAAHFLPHVGEHHKCKRLHGHTYKIEVVVRGEVNPNTGFVVDFSEIDRYVKPLIDRLDHRLLNDIIPNPTAEVIGLWFLTEIPVKYVYSVRVWETPRCYAEVFQRNGFWTGDHRMAK